LLDFTARNATAGFAPLRLLRAGPFTPFFNSHSHSGRGRTEPTHFSWSAKRRRTSRLDLAAARPYHGCSAVWLTK